jgi:alpha-glucoside transport system permease protein
MDPAHGRLMISSLRPPDDISRTGWWTVISHPFSIGLDRGQLRAGADRSRPIQRVSQHPARDHPAGGHPDHHAAFAACLRLAGIPCRRFFFTVVGLMVVPLQMSLIPLLRLYTQMDSSRTFLGIWLAHTGFRAAAGNLPAIGYISTLPGEIIESARRRRSPLTTFTRLCCRSRFRSSPVRHLPVPVGVE